MTKQFRTWNYGFLLPLLLLALNACTVNPVTGERELGLVSAQQEIAIGTQQYVPTQQMQGGELVHEPALARYVSEVGKRLAAQSERQLPYEFVVLNNDVPNAWAMPGGKIAINRGLLTELDNEAELAAVLGHEVVHAAARHSAQQMERGILLQIGVIAAGVAAGDSEYAGLAVGAGIVGAQLISQKYSRDAELEADRYGIRYLHAAGYDPAAAVSLQETFVRLSEGRQQDWLTGLFASHPPSQERVQRNRELAAQLGTTGRLNREQYQAVTTGIRKAEPAYAKAADSRKALQDGKLAEAAKLANEAIKVVPQEAAFHALLGDIALGRKNKAEALSHYNSAVERNPGYFAFRIQRGEMLLAKNSVAAARNDFEAANQLLPTAIAHERLGDIALRERRRGLAVEHYRIAAQSDSASGQRARRKLAELGQPPGQ